MRKSFFTVLGILLIVTMNLIPDPPTGAVHTISKFSKKNMGTVKIFYDCSCVAASLLIGFPGTHKIIGFGIATIASAICVGIILALLQVTVGRRMKQYFPEQRV